MPLPRLGKPPFLTAEDVKDSDILEIADEPYVVPAEQTKWGRPRGRAVVKLSDGELRTWTMNTTTWDRLLDAFSDKEAMWIGKRVKVRKETQTISGSDKEVLFGYPYKEPQQTLDADKPVDLSQENKQIVQALASMSPEQRKGLLEALQSWSISCEWCLDRYRCSIRRDHSRLKSENERLRDALKKLRDSDER